MADTDQQYLRRAEQTRRRGQPRQLLHLHERSGPPEPAHTACDGHGHVLARWASETSPIETWVPFAGFTRRVVIP